jgi:hypothetical protein
LLSGKALEDQSEDKATGEGAADCDLWPIGREGGGYARERRREWA